MDRNGEVGERRGKKMKPDPEIEAGGKEGKGCKEMKKEQ